MIAVKNFVNQSNLAHAGYALAMQFVFGLATGSFWGGAVLAVGFFIGRELTQAEYRWIDQFGQGKRANLPDWGMFDRRVWTHIDSWMDWILPTISVSIVAVLDQFFPLIQP